MRELILHRRRALASFALRYFCVMDQNPAAFMSALEADPATARFANRGDYALRNGESIRIPLDEEAHTFFIAIYTESHNLVTNVISVSPGPQSEEYSIITDYNGYDKLAYYVVPTGQEPEKFRK
jgi:hypothetical protein